jgi:gluconate:H+ symporter, GntP family
VAQGSGTVSMITSSAMIAAMLAPAGGTPVTLPFHPVYLATAIGAGSLVGSWMNDSGFWIFAKMGGLTEVEGLKSWTILLIVLGIASMATTVVLSMVLPLV